MIDMSSWLKENVLPKFPGSTLEWSQTRGMFRLTLPGEFVLGQLHPYIQEIGILCPNTDGTTVILVHGIRLAAKMSPDAEPVQKVREPGARPAVEERPKQSGPRGSRFVRYAGKVTEEVFGTPVAVPGIPYDGAFRLEGRERQRGFAGTVDYEMDTGGRGSSRSYTDYLKDPNRLK